MQIDPVSAALGRIEETCKATNETVCGLQKAINGNGQPGLIQRMAELENWKAAELARVDERGTAVKNAQWALGLKVSIAAIVASGAVHFVTDFLAKRGH